MMMIASGRRPDNVRKPRIAIERFLANLPLFRGLEAKDIARIAGGATEVDAPRGTILYRKGDSCRGLYVLVFGQVKLSLETPQGGERVVELVAPGGSFGETAIFLDRPYVFTAGTLGDSKLVHVAKETVLAELERTPGFMRGIVGVLSRRLHHFVSELEDFTLHSGTERVIGHLLEWLPQDAKGRGTVVTLPAKKGVIASQLNLTQEHFSRILRELSGAGLIEVEGRNVRLCDLDALRARLQQP